MHESFFKKIIEKYTDPLKKTNTFRTYTFLSGKIFCDADEYSNKIMQEFRYWGKDRFMLCD